VPRPPKGRSRAEERRRLEEEAARVEVGRACDVCVLGAGAAGLAATIASAEAGAATVALERGLSLGQKILVTGNGRCNLSNLDLDPSRYNDPAFVAEAAGAGFGADVLSLMEGSGLVVTEEDGRLYPLSRQASSVRDVLLARARRADAVLAPGREVTRVERAGDALRVSYAPVAGADGAARERTVRARCVVVALGGGAPLDALLARGLGLEVRPWEPVLCPIGCAGAGRLLAELDGRRAHVSARLVRGGSEVAREAGEVIFRPYGVSGIVAFDLSRRCLPHDSLVLDLAPGHPSSELRRAADAAGSGAHAGRRGARRATEAAAERLHGFLDPVIASALAREAAAQLDGAPGEEEVLERALALAKGLELAVEGPAEPKRAQVSRGGLALAQFSPASLACRDVPGLFAAGEALDVDADCGGFNLAWAWKSGMVAGSAAAARALAGRGA
jgi:predicted Rossmann fold flavoprotein